MTQTSNPFLDELAKLMTNAAGAAQGMRREFETVMKAQGELFANYMNLWHSTALRMAGQSVEPVVRKPSLMPTTTSWLGEA